MEKTARAPCITFQSPISHCHTVFFHHFSPLIKPVCSSDGELQILVGCCNRTERAGAGRDMPPEWSEQFSPLQLPGCLPDHPEEPPGSRQTSRTGSSWCRCSPRLDGAAARTACTWRSSGSSGTGWWTRERSAQYQSLQGIQRNNQECNSNVPLKPTNPAMTLLNIPISIYIFVHLSVPCSNIFLFKRMLKHFHVQKKSIQEFFKLKTSKDILRINLICLKEVYQNFNQCKVRTIIET